MAECVRAATGHVESTQSEMRSTTAPLSIEKSSLVIVQCSNDMPVGALHKGAVHSGRQNEGGSMRKISDTIARLGALRARGAIHSPDVIASGRLSVLGDFGSNPGALRAHRYLPDRAEGAPLVVVLHGCTQTAAGYDYMSGWSQLADEGGFALLYPEQQRANNPNLCFNWFQPADTTRDRGEALSIRQMIEAMLETYDLDRERVFVTGLSAGGAMATAMLANYPEMFAGGGIIAGLPYGSARTIPEAFDRMRGHGGPSEQDLQRLLQRSSTYSGPWPRVSIWQGSSDHTVAPSNADAIASQWRGVHKLKTEPSRLTTAGSHSRQAWHNAAGDVAIEINTIHGMGHGAPLDGHLGVPGPYMLDVGISSTREIARFWGLLNERVSATSTRSASARQRPAPSLEGQGAPKLALGRGQNTSASTATRQVIEDALRAAGLMR